MGLVTTHQINLLATNRAYQYLSYNMSCISRKPDFCLCENKDADQLYSDCTADQRLCFHYMGSTIPPVQLISAFVFTTWVVQYLLYS